MWVSGWGRDVGPLVMHGVWYRTQYLAEALGGTYRGP